MERKKITGTALLVSDRWVGHRTLYIYAKISCSSYFLSGTRVFVNVVSLFREVFLPGTDLVLRIRCLVRTDFCSYDLPKLIVNS